MTHETKLITVLTVLLSLLSVGVVSPPPSTAATTPPNIVLILTDDLSGNLVKYMPNVMGLQRQGTTFLNFTVTDSLCCPSRASIFTGEFPHNTGVVANGGPDGGYEGFAGHGDENKSFAVRLSNHGYRTWFGGNDFNAYHPCGDPAPGWTDWYAINDGGYNGWDYRMANGKPKTCSWYGGDDPTKPDYHNSADYATYNLRAKVNGFIRSDPGPFFAEVATFAPHFPYTPAPGDGGLFPDVTAQRNAKWNAQVTGAPQWLQKAPMSQDLIDRNDYVFRQRVREVQSVDGAIGNIEQVLKNRGEWANTYFIFASDNGFHTGEYRLAPGKMTAFDTDVNVPLIITGPGVCHGCKNYDMVSNIDLAPTFEQMADAGIRRETIDGHSFLPLLQGQSVPWRTFVGVEHTNTKECTPDCQPIAAGALPSYNAIRTADFTYVEDATGEFEYYDRAGGDLDVNGNPLAADPNELHNVYDQLPQSRKNALHVRVEALSTCDGYTECWQQAVVA